MAKLMAVIVLALITFCAFAGEVQTKATTKKAQPKATTKSTTSKASATREAEAAKARAEIKDMLDLLHEGLLVLRYDAPVTAELLSVDRTVNGKTIEGKPESSTIYADDDIGIGWVTSPQQLSFVLHNTTKQTMRVIWDNAVLVDTDEKNHRVIHSGVRMIDADKLQPPSTILAGTKLEDLVYPADMLEFKSGEWHREPMFEHLDVGDKIRVLLPLEVDGQVREYIFAFRVRAADPEGLRDREHKDIIEKLGDEATLEKIASVLEREPDAREEQETSFGKLTRVTYRAERLVFNVLDGKLDSIEVLQ